MHLEGKQVAALVADHFEDSELTKPVEYLREHGAQVTLVGQETGKTYKGKQGKAEVQADRTFSEVSADEFDAVYIAGGMQPEELRMNKQVLDFVQQMDRQGKLIIAMCHGPLVLVSAGLVQGKRLTSWPALQDDLRNAGAEWVNEAVVVDDRYITSRKPDDIPQLNEAISKALEREPATVR